MHCLLLPLAVALLALPACLAASHDQDPTRSSNRPANSPVKVSTKRHFRSSCGITTTPSKKEPPWWAYASPLRFLTGWSLGEKYPKAREALVEVRNRDEKVLRDGTGSVHLAMDVAAINQRLGERAKTVSLFRHLHEKRKSLAIMSFEIVQDDLVKEGEYRLCSEYIKDPLQRFSQLKAMHEFTGKLGGREKSGSDVLRRVGIEIFRDQICRLIEVLAGSGRKAEADKVYDKALTVFEEREDKEALGRALKTEQKK
jgi:hypothetical protein